MGLIFDLHFPDDKQRQVSFHVFIAHFCFFWRNVYLSPRSLFKIIGCFSFKNPLQYSWASLVAQLVKNPPAMWETWV